MTGKGGRPSRRCFSGKETAMEETNKRDEKGRKRRNEKKEKFASFGRKGPAVWKLTLGALYVAFFALAGNVPVLSAIQLIPGVPITLQIFLVAMMGLTLGVRGGLTSLGAVWILTFCGLPMMAGGRGGPAVFLGPTAGYVFGWFFLVLLTGLYADGPMKQLLHKKWRGMSIHLPAAFLIGMAGVGIDYLCGSLFLAAVGGKALSDIPALLLSNLAFLPGDMVKIGLAAFLSLSLFAVPALRGIFPARE